MTRSDDHRLNMSFQCTPGFTTTVIPAHPFRHTGGCRYPACRSPRPQGGGEGAGNQKPEGQNHFWQHILRHTGGCRYPP